MPPVKISKDKDLKAVVDYFNKPPPKPRDLEAEARAAAAAEAAARAKAEEEAAIARERAEAEAAKAAREVAQEEARRKAEFDADPLNRFDDKDFVTPVAELSEQKKRDYGYGVPQWSPYRMTKVTSTDEWKSKLWSTTNSEWGGYSKRKNALDPATQSRLARGMVQEMKANASIDHTWEIVGRRPGQEQGKPQFFMP